jgi:hypothetical protein
LISIKIGRPNNNTKWITLNNIVSRSISFTDEALYIINLNVVRHEKNAGKTMKEPKEIFYEYA